MKKYDKPRLSKQEKDFDNKVLVCFLLFMGALIVLGVFFVNVTPETFKYFFTF